MTQPTLAELIGAGTVFNTTTNILEIPLSALQLSGLDTTTPTATNVLAAIIKNSHGWLKNNEDQSVMVASSLSILSPVQRNEVDRTEFGYTFTLYGSYQAPEFDPDEV